jgi:hypothetical protein
MELEEVTDREYQYPVYLYENGNYVDTFNHWL